MQYKDDATV